jgi:hypothetical protein
MHGDNDTDLRCPDCGSMNLVLDYVGFNTVYEISFGSCLDCPNVWPVELEDITHPEHDPEIEEEKEGL